jgi:hypothetical protein
MMGNLGNMEGTKWELYGNTMETKKSKKSTPLPQTNYHPLNPVVICLFVS